MTLTWDNFPEFYTQAHELVQGRTREVYPWQRALVDAVSRDGCLPDAIITPTGAGKTIVAYVHVFRAAMDPTAPPRFIHVTPRRSLVDQMYDELSLLADKLKDATTLPPLLGEVRDRLLSRRLPDVTGNTDPSKGPLIAVARRGGVYGSPAREWKLDPNAVTVMTMTAHQAISALLFSGYGTPLFSRASEAGLFGLGTVMVFDESHITRQAVTTARSVAGIVAEYSMASPGISVRPLEIVEMSATPADDTRSLPRIVTLIDDDKRDPDCRIGQVLASPKPLKTITATGKITGTLVEQAVELHRTVGRGSESGRTVGVVVNSVREAISVRDNLCGLRVNAIAITGRMRGADRDWLTGRFASDGSTEDADGHISYPGVLTSDGNDRVDVLVATQTIEIGMDINLAGMVTELAPADALAQRFGRVNRCGETTRGPIVVVIPKQPDTRVYSKEDLSKAAKWLEGFDDVATIEVFQGNPSVRHPQRKIVEKFTRGDAIDVSLISGMRTFRAFDADMWLSDDITRFPETRIALRRGAPVLNADDRKEMLEALPVESSEEWVLHGPTAAFGFLKELTVASNGTRMRKWLDNITAATLVGFGGEYLDLLIRNGEFCYLDRKEGMYKNVSELDMLSGCVVLWVTGPLPITAEGDISDNASAMPVNTELLRRNPYRDTSLRVKVLIGDEIASFPSRPILNSGDKTGSEEPSETVDDDLVDDDQRAEWDCNDPSAWWMVIKRQVDQPSSFVKLPKFDDKPKWAVVLPWENAPDAYNQIRTIKKSPVLLRDHQSDVGAYAGWIADHCLVTGVYRESLVQAGLHHDDGKRDNRFQAMLRRDRDGSTDYGTQLIAKSDDPRVRENYRTYGMPAGWRHEQLSACYTYEQFRDDPELRDLVTWLVGTSHGHGRSLFPHSMTELVKNGIPNGAADIFTDGRWNELGYDLTTRMGPWHLGFMEALLRASDQNTSRQGH